MRVQDPPATQPGSTAARSARQLQALATDRRRAARRFTKFAIVGASGVPVTLLVNYLLHVTFGLPLILSTALAVEAAIITNFAGNHVWTFRGAEERQRRIPFAERHHLIGPLVTWALQPTVRRFVKFNAVSLVGLVVTTTITTFLANQYGPELRALAGDAYFVPANLAGIGVAMVWNFLANAVWTWA
jgi:dolichol-phosphate mannosyltransferase